MEFGQVYADPRALMKGLTPIQLEGMVEEYLQKTDPMWVLAMCDHDLSSFGDLNTASLVGFHWMEHLCPELGNAEEFMRQAREMLNNPSFLLGNDVDQFKRDHLLTGMLVKKRAGWELFYLLCKYLQIPGMFLLHQGVYVTQDQVFQLTDQRVIFMCGPKEMIRVLRPSLRGIYGVYSWTMNPETARDIMRQGGGKGKGKKSSSSSKRKRQEASVIERSRELLGESMEQQEDQPPAKRTSHSGEGDSSGLPVTTPPEITATITETTVTTTMGEPTGMEGVTVTATASTSGATVTAPAPVVSEGDEV